MEPRFKITKEKFGQQDLIKLEDLSNNEFVTILPETGAMLHSCKLNYNGKHVSILDDYCNEEELKEALSSSFKGSNLFPYPNRVDGGKYVFNKKEYQMPVNSPSENNSLHGLIFDKKFEIIEETATDEKAIVTFQFDSNGDLPGFPFKFKYIIQYELDSINGLTINTSVTNIDNQPIPVGFGFHPYIKLETEVNNLQLEFPADESFLVNNRMLPTEETQSYTQFNNLKLISNTEFDTCFSLSTKDPIAQIKIISDELKGGGINIWQETGENKLNFLQIYTPPHRNSIAIEPMTCIANAFNNKIGLIELNPETTSTVKWGIKKVE